MKNPCSPDNPFGKLINPAPTRADEDARKVSVDCDVKKSLLHIKKRESIIRQSFTQLPGMQQSSSKDELTPQPDVGVDDASVLYIKGTIRQAQPRPKVDTSPITYRQRSRSNSSSSRPKTGLEPNGSEALKSLAVRRNGAPSTAPGVRRNSLKSGSMQRKGIRATASSDYADPLIDDGPWQCLKCFAENDGDMPGCYHCATAKGSTGARGDDSKVIVRANVGGFKR